MYCSNVWPARSSGDPWCGVPRQTTRLSNCGQLSCVSRAYWQALRMTRPPMLCPTRDSDCTGTGQLPHNRSSMPASWRPLVEIWRPVL